MIYKLNYFARGNSISASSFNNKYTLFINLNYVVCYTNLRMFTGPLSGHNIAYYAQIQLLDNTILNIDVDAYHAFIKVMEQNYSIEELERYKQGYNEVIAYFDSIADEEKPKLNKRLKKLGL